MAGVARAVFLSYRRGETSHIAGRLADRLTDRLGPEQVFMDVDAIDPGADFAVAIAREVASCRILIALIGPNWSRITDKRGRRRLDDPDDFVVLEIRAALERGIRVIPVLVDGAVMPGRGDLPEGIQGLARRNAVRLDHDTFRSHVTTVLNAIPCGRGSVAPRTASNQSRLGATVATARKVPLRSKFRRRMSYLPSSATATTVVVIEWRYRSPSSCSSVTGRPISMGVIG
ncbi:MAG: toll/interleukin-1 receptor domain-containing protein [Pseudonocardiaceae bacterium]